VSYALNLLGSRAAPDLVFATAVARGFRGISPGLVDMSALWHHGLYCGLIARRLAKRCGILDGERLLVAGMLHDIGQFALYRTQPALAAEALIEADNNDSGMLRAEREIFGYTHAEIGGALLRAWELPESLAAIPRHHHAPQEAGEHRLESAIMHIAGSMANRIEPGRKILACRQEIEPRAWEITGLTPPQADLALDEANQEVLDGLELLLPGKPLLP
jgi:putative nucleotidyltransferase with HDIG domain